MAVIGLIQVVIAAITASAGLKQVGEKADARAIDRHDRLVSALVRHTVQTLELPDSTSPPDSFEFAVELAGIPLVATLARRSIRAEGFQVLEDHGGSAPVAADPGPVRTYRGIVVGRPDSRVTAFLDGDGALRARIKFGETIWHIEPVPPTRWRGRRPEHVVYRGEDVIGSSGTCGVDSSDTPIAVPLRDSGGGAETRGGFEFFRAQIAFDADYEYFDEYGSTSAVQAQIETNMLECEDIYEDDVELCWEITVIVVRNNASDPYSDEENASALLAEFANHWNANFAGTPRTTAHLMTGKDLEGSTIGIARVGGIRCFGGSPDVSEAYGLQEDIVIQSRRTELCAHELGHNWNACHCDDASDCVEIEDCGIMSSSVGLTEGRTHFSEFSRDQIEAHIALVSACQLQPCGCGVMILIPEYPFATIETAIASATCGSIVSIRFGTYTVPTGILNSGPGRAVRVEARGGTVFINRQ